MISFEIKHRHFSQTGQLNALFHTSTDVVNRVALRQNTDWLLPNSDFPPNEPKMAFVAKTVKNDQNHPKCIFSENCVSLFIQFLI